MKTQELLNSLQDKEFVSREEAAQLASVALKEFSKRSKAAKIVDRAVFDMAIAGGCANRVFNAVEKLVAEHA